MNIVIVTPCSRPENLEKIKKSINLPCRWIIVYDSDIAIKKFNDPWIIELNIKGGISGNLQRNMALDYVEKNEWVYFLDDDNLLHPDFIKIKEGHEAIAYLYKDSFTLPFGYLFPQEMPDGNIRMLDKNNIKVCFIDQAQYLLHMSLIGQKRFTQQYEADGIFIEGIYKEYCDKIIIAVEPVCYYNKLRQ